VAARSRHVWTMSIVCTRTHPAKNGSPSVTHRLVESRREGDKVRQKTRLNLGRTFPIAKENGTLVCQRVDELMTNQATLHVMTLPADIETEARRIAQRLLERRERMADTPDWETVDVHSVPDSDAHSMGIEHAALDALTLLDSPNTLCALGLNTRQQTCARATIIDQRTQPGSESCWGSIGVP